MALIRAQLHVIEALFHALDERAHRLPGHIADERRQGPHLAVVKASLLQLLDVVRHVAWVSVIRRSGLRWCFHSTPSGG